MQQLLQYTETWDYQSNNKEQPLGFAPPFHESIVFRIVSEGCYECYLKKRACSFCCLFASNEGSFTITKN